MRRRQFDRNGNVVTGPPDINHHISHPVHETIMVTAHQTALNYLNYAQRKHLKSNESNLSRTPHNLCYYSDPMITIIRLVPVFQTRGCHLTTALLTVSEFRRGLAVIMISV